jgi:hypothetical protein
MISNMRFRVQRGVNIIGAWLSLVERSVRDREVVGSNPIAPTFKIDKLWLPDGSHFLFTTLSTTLSIQAVSASLKANRRIHLGWVQGVR